MACRFLRLVLFRSVGLPEFGTRHANDASVFQNVKVICRTVTTPAAKDILVTSIAMVRFCPSLLERSSLLQKHSCPSFPHDACKRRASTKTSAMRLIMLASEIQ